MQIQLYKSLDAPIKANKTLIPLATLNGTPTTAFSIDAPSFVVSYTSVIPSVNYAYIPDFGKYYFVRPPVLNTDGTAILTMDIDVLKTYYSSIMNCDAVVIRSQSQGLNNVPDKQLPIDPNAIDIVSILGTKGFDKLTVMGSVGGGGLPSVQTVLITGRGRN